MRQILPDLFQPIITQHTSHPYSSTHALLSVNLADKNIELRFLPLDLRLIPETGRYLSLLAAKSTQLHNILRYIQEVQAQIQSEFKASQDLPSKFIRNIEEALQEQNQCSWVQAAYHLVVTGICYPSVKEWLVDELGERVCWFERSAESVTEKRFRATKDGKRQRVVATKTFDVSPTRTLYQLWNV